MIQYELTAPQRGLQFHCSRLRSWSRDQVDPSPPHPLFSMQAYLSLFATRCTFFFFWCHKNHEEPEDPNTCPYKSVDAMLHHIKSQPKWIEWRNAPLEKRPSLARNITKHFHPDKWDEFNPTCDIDHKGALPRMALPRCKNVARNRFFFCRKMGRDNFAGGYRSDYEGPRRNEEESKVIQRLVCCTVCHFRSRINWREFVETGHQMGDVSFIFSIVRLRQLMPTIDPAALITKSSSLDGVL